MKLLLTFCSRTCTLDLVGWLRFGPTGFFGDGNENGCFNLCSFSNLNLKNSVVSLKNWAKECFSTDFASKYSLASTYLTGTWIYIFFFLFHFNFLLGHVVGIDFYAGFSGFLSTPPNNTKEKLSVSPCPIWSEDCCSLHCLLLKRVELL